MPVLKQQVEQGAFNRGAILPFQLRNDDFSLAMQDIYVRFTEVYLGEVTIADFRRNARGELGTRTATLHREGIEKLRKNWVYELRP